MFILVDVAQNECEVQQAPTGNNERHKPEPTNAGST